MTTNANTGSYKTIQMMSEDYNAMVPDAQRLGLPFRLHPSWFANRVEAERRAEEIRVALVAAGFDPAPLLCEPIVGVPQRPRADHSKSLPRAPRPVVRVGAERIETCLPNSAEHCMIADELRAMGYSRPLVDMQTIRFTDKKRGARFSYLTPPTAQDALISLDRGIKPEPFEFRLGGTVRVTKAGDGSDPANNLGKTTVRQNRGSLEIVGGQPPKASTFARTRMFGKRILGDDFTLCPVPAGRYERPIPPAA